MKEKLPPDRYRLESVQISNLGLYTKPEPDLPPIQLCGAGRPTVIVSM